MSVCLAGWFVGWVGCLSDTLDNVNIECTSTNRTGDDGSCSSGWMDGWRDPHSIDAFAYYEEHKQREQRQEVARINL